jgi:hypothetical protein
MVRPDVSVLMKYTKLSIGMAGMFLTGCLVGLLLGAAGIAGVRMMVGTKKGCYPQSPRRSVNITINASHRDELFAQLRKFATKYDFRVIIDPISPSGEDFLISMYREDVEIHGSNPFVPGEYELAFYDADCHRPVNEAVLDDLVSNLESLVNEVPSAKFSLEVK